MQKVYTPSFASSPRWAGVNNCFLVLIPLYYYLTDSSIGKFMPYKDLEVRKAKHKEYSKKYYEKNKAKVQAAVNINRRTARQAFRMFKASLSCTKCGENHPATLDFHHHTPHKDNIKISKLLADGRFSLAMSEIKEKCIVLCSNCHRKHHYEEQKK